MSDCSDVHRLELYRWAVQDPLTQMRVLDRIYRTCYPGRVPTRLREDFAGNCADSVAWVALAAANEAVAVDLDAQTLDWGMARARRLLGTRAQRLHALAADVFAVAPPQVEPAHLLAALNFSLFYFHSRERLRDYFSHARTCIAPDGLLVANAYGGPDTQRAHRDVQTVADRPGLPGEAAPPAFDYEWEQRGYDALSARTECRIHFALADGSNLRDAFVYDWRMWTLPELTEVAREAGFGRVEVWRHTYDPERGAAGVFLGPVTSIAEELDTWVAYLVAGP